MIGLKVFLSLLLLHATSATLHVNLCCAKSSGNCRSACEEITSNLPINEEDFNKNDLIVRLQDYCPSQKNVPLWRCVNQTDVHNENEIKWAGRVCCHLAETEPCHQACRNAERAEDLNPKCRMSDEITLFECVEKKEKGEACCDMAKNSRCHSLCRKSLVSRRVTRQHMETACAGNVNNCMNNLTPPNSFTISTKLGHCCDLANNVKCREHCKLLVSSKSSDVAIIQDLHANECGMMQSSAADMWMCIISSPDMQSYAGSMGGGMGGGMMYPGGMGGIGSGLFPGGNSGSIGLLNPGMPSGSNQDWRVPNRHPTVAITSPRPNNNIREVGMDVTKAYCCSKATGQKCRKLCHDSFSSEWQTQWKEFDKTCLHDKHQRNLTQCLDDVNESCELGCDGLSFCTTFNHRPTQLFRSCNALNDEAAAKEVTRWQMNGFLEIPYLNDDFKLYIKDIPQCNPVVWKTLACTLMIKPCTKDTHSNRICRSNCYKTLSSCLDWQKMEGFRSAHEICENLSPADNEKCINLDDFLEEKKPPPIRTASGKIIPSRLKPLSTSKHDMSMRASPCKNSTCNPMQICNVNRGCSGKFCPDFSCETGCRLGEISMHKVPVGTYAKILTNVPDNEKVCTKICQCSDTGMFNNCHPSYCTNFEICRKDGFPISHGTVLNGTCPKCVCNGGELICNKHQCKPSSSKHTGSTEVSRFTGLPCNCSATYSPVCGWNGVTFPNDCLAKCNGLEDGQFKAGSCSSLNPCSNKPCADNEECIWNPKVCLFLLGKDCPQYECVRKEERCPPPQLGVPTTVCSAEEEEYPSLCELVKKKDDFHYKGPCLSDCDESFEICGMDGNTYNSECAAHAHRVMKDYSGKCRALGLAGQKPRCPKEVKCPKLPRSSCIGYIPPGACCPYCGAAIRILFSRKEIDKAFQSLGMRAMDVFTVEKTVAALERHIQVKNCRLFGHLTFENDLMLMMVPIKERSTMNEIQLCFKEAEKLKVLINTRNPRFLSEVGLSPLIHARETHHRVSAAAIATLLPILYLLPIISYYLR